MSLVALARSASPGGGEPPASSRPAASSSKASSGPAPSRPISAARPERVAASSRPGSRFANVLDAAQHQEAPPSTDAEAGVAAALQLPGSDREPGPEAVGTSDAPVAPAVAMPLESPTPAPLHTPWLLLALGVGLPTRTHEVEVSTPDATVGGEPSNLSTENAIAVSGAEPSAAATRSDATVPRAATLELPSGQAVTAVPQGRLVETAAPDPDVAMAETGGKASPPAATGGSPVAVPPAESALQGALDAVTAASALRGGGDGPPAAPALRSVVEAPPQEGSKAIGPAAAQPADVLSRWRAATRASGGVVTARPSMGDVRAEDGAATAIAAAGVANRLVQLLGRPDQEVDARSQGVPAAGAAEGLGLAAGALTVTSGGSFVATRASEALLRLAQADAGGQTGQNGSPSSAPVPLLPAATVALLSSASSPAPAAPVLPPEVADQVMQQLVSSLKMQWKDGVGEAKLHLRPDALGAVTVSLRVEQGAVTAVVRAESAQVHEWVLQHQQSLRQQMEAAGLHLKELVVSPDDQRQQAREDSSSEPERRRPRPRAEGAGTADTPRFELLV